MIAYNNIWLYNKVVREQSDEALRHGCISVESHYTVYAKHEVKFYSPQFFARVGLALLTLVIVSFFWSLCLLMFGSHAADVLAVLVGIASYIAAEILIREKAHYNSGIDNMLVWLAFLFSFIGIMVLMLWSSLRYSGAYQHVKYADVKLSIIAFIISSLLVLRFTDAVMSIVAVLSLMCLVYYCSEHLGLVANGAAPFIMMLIFGLLYVMSRRVMRQRGALLYHKCLACVSVTALIILYTAGNYYVVDTVGSADAAIGNRVAHDAVSKELPLGWFFWIWTFGVPVAYLVYGIRKKDIVRIRVGIPLLAVAIATFRYYHHIMAPEMAMMLGGLLIFVASYALISRLRKPRGGFTFEPDIRTEERPDVGKMLTTEIIGDAARTGGPAQSSQESDWS